MLTVFSGVYVTYFIKKFALNFRHVTYTADARKGGRYRRFHACTYLRVAHPAVGVTGGSMATRRCSYMAAFKLKLVEYAETHSNRCAGWEFNVCEKIICDWRKK